MHATTTATAPPLPRAMNERKHPVQVEVRVDLLTSVKRELRAKNITMRQAVEYGLARWLCEVNPAEARRLGVTGR